MRKLRFVFALSAFCLFAGLSVSGQSSAGDQSGATAKNERYRIGYQDILDIQVFRHTELNQRIPVNSNGTINLYRLERPVVALCRTERELATDIANAYREKYLRDPQVTVVV